MYTPKGHARLVVEAGVAIMYYSDPPLVLEASVVT